MYVKQTRHSIPIAMTVWVIVSSDLLAFYLDSLETPRIRKFLDCTVASIDPIMKLIMKLSIHFQPMKIA